MRPLKLLCCLLMLPLAAPAQSSAAKSLRGLSSFHILIEELNPAAAAANITEDDLEREVELKLRLAGIPIKNRLSSDAVIYVNLNVMELEKLYRSYVFVLRLEISQLSKLSGNGQISRVVTWNRSILGKAPGRETTYIRNQLKLLLDHFLNDYLTVNPKTR